MMMKIKDLWKVVLRLRLSSSLEKAVKSFFPPGVSPPGLVQSGLRADKGKVDSFAALRQ